MEQIQRKGELKKNFLYAKTNTNLLEMNKN